MNRQLLWLAVLAASAYATPQVGVTAQASRGKITANLGINRWDPSPLFQVLIQSSNQDWGYDVVQSTNTLAPADAAGKPSQTGWHDNPTALTIVLVVQGTVWNQEKENPSCLTPLPAGTVFFEHSGSIHNFYNLDPRVATVLQVTHLIERGESATRRDQPDPVTGDPNTASPPPPVCAAGAAVAIPSGRSGDNTYQSAPR